MFVLIRSVLKRTVVGEKRNDDPSGSHLRVEGIVHVPSVDAMLCFTAGF